MRLSAAVASGALAAMPKINNLQPSERRQVAEESENLHLVAQRRAIMWHR